MRNQLISGLIINFFILLISVWNIRGDYRLFIANLAAVDIACGKCFSSIIIFGIFSTALRLYGLCKFDAKRETPNLKCNYDLLGFCFLRVFWSFDFCACAGLCKSGCGSVSTKSI
jgi:hypothetical protein